MRPYSFVLEASTTKPFNLEAQGNYVRYRKVLTGIDAPEILIETNKGDLIPLLPGEDAYLGEMCEHFKVFNVLGTVAMTGVLMIAGGFDGVKFSSDRISGEVSVIDGGRSKTMAGAAFSAYASVGAVSAKYGHALLLNPVGSGKRVIVESSTYDISTSDGVILVGTYSTVLGNIGTAPLNKYVKASPTAAAAQVSYDFLSSGLTFGNQEVRTVKGYSPYSRKHTQPIILAPGYGIAVQHLSTNQGLSVYWEFNEELDT